MPGRKFPIITGEIYHVFNRGINRKPTFITQKEYARAKLCIKYYQFSSPSIKLSKFLIISRERREEIWNNLSKSNQKLVEILCYCLMPNHFHLLLKQVKDGGIPKFLSNFQNSYTRYFNALNQRDGPLFLDQFKAVRIEADEQLIHVSRYIHLNPYTSYVVKTLEELTIYPWSSFQEYLENNGFSNKSIVLDFFKKKDEYKKFVFDQANYQRTLKQIEHVIFD